MKINCPPYVNTALRLLNESGFKAYIVGGCVRDRLMGNEPDDWDMTTSALPEETQYVFCSFRTIPTGLKHGTVTVLIDGHPLEITTMRVDGEYRDSRRPDTVSFTDEITTDLSRRDFTVNAMAYSPEDGLVDPFDGRGDIERKLIRCVGDPEKRFGEDALRIIRALRFASKLDFEINAETAASILKMHTTMQNVASERIRVELVKLLMGQSAERILTEYKKVIFGIIPELEPTDGFPQKTPYHIYDVWSHIVKVVGAVKNEPAFRVAALMHDIAKPDCLKIDENGVAHFKGHEAQSAEIAKRVMQRLHFSNAEIKKVYDMIMLHDRRPDGTKIGLAHLCADYSVEAVGDALELMLADAEGKSPSCRETERQRCETAKQQLAQIIGDNVPLCTHELDVNGNDLMQLGVTGRQIRTMLDSLLDAVIDGKLVNEKQQLLNYANKIKKV